MHADYHTHTHLCRHAVGTPLDYRQAAVHKGLPQIACTDHCPTPDGFGADHRMQPAQFHDYRQAVAEAQRGDGIQVLLGIEADFYTGCEENLRKLEAEHPFDLVLGSVHFLDYWRQRGLTGAAPFEVWRDYFQLIARLAASGLFDIAAHLDLPKRSGNPISEKDLRPLALPALDALAQAGMAIEINTSGLIHSCRELYPALPLLSWARERQIGLTLGSDAHDPGRVGADFELAVAHAKAAGYTTVRRYQSRRFVDIPL